MDQVNWAEVHHNTDPALVSDTLPHVTHSGFLKIGSIELRVYQLSDGNRVIDGQDLIDFFNT